MRCNPPVHGRIRVLDLLSCVGVDGQGLLLYWALLRLVLEKCLRHFHGRNVELELLSIQNEGMGGFFLMRIP